MNLIMNSSLENAEVDLASEMAVDKSAWEECWLGAQSGWWSFLDLNILMIKRTVDLLIPRVNATVSNFQSSRWLAIRID